MSREIEVLISGLAAAAAIHEALHLISQRSAARTDVVRSLPMRHLLSASGFVQSSTASAAVAG